MRGLIGVLLAAGQSRRMGRPKQLMPWPSSDSGRQRTVVAASFDAIAGLCDRMIVVVGDHADDVAQSLSPRQCTMVHSSSKAEMIESIRTGLNAAADLPDWTAILLHPADVPGVALQTVRQIVDLAQTQPDVAIMPEFDGSGGHPVLIPRGLVQPILAYHGPGGLRAFWEAHPAVRLRLPVTDPGCLRDLDTPEDYHSASGGRIPF